MHCHYLFTMDGANQQWNDIDIENKLNMPHYPILTLLYKNWYLKSLEIIAPMAIGHI